MEGLLLALLVTKTNNTFMKTSFTLSLLFVMATALAQTTTQLPRSEFTISISASSLNIKPGESKQVTVSIIRSKAFAKGKVTLGFSSVLPQGVSVVYEPTEGNFETSLATLTAGPAAVAGTYQLVFNGTIYYKTKGSTLKLSVSNENVAVK